MQNPHSRTATTTDRTSLRHISLAVFAQAKSRPEVEPKSAKDRFSAKFPHVNQEYFAEVTKDLLRKRYPKHCPDCETEMEQEVGGRETAIRCRKCKRQASRTSGTPLHHLKLPLWVFGYLLNEAIQRYPQVVSGAEIERRLGCSNNTALLLKRRRQLFLSDLLPAVKEKMLESLKADFANTEFPKDRGADVTELVKGKSPVNMDTLALFSASQRANGGRARYRHGGQMRAPVNSCP